MKQEQQKQNIIDIMKGDEQLGLYEETLEEVAENYVPKSNKWTIKDIFQDGAIWQQEFNDTSKVNRVEVIQHSEPYNGRAYTNYNAKEVETQLQDDGKTLKIFLK